MHTVTVAAGVPPGEMYIVDHQARTATSLTLSATLADERPNCVLMVNGAQGYVGTNPLPAPTPGNIYSISITGVVVTETLLNNNAGHPALPPDGPREARTAGSRAVSSR